MQREFDFSAIPALLRALPQWVCWQWRTREGKKTKVPYNARTGTRAMTNNSATWSSFAQAEEGVQSGRFDGIGIVLTQANGLVGGDLDHCVKSGQLSAASGQKGSGKAPKKRASSQYEIEEWAAQIIGEVQTYTEITPSGEGLRFFALGELPPGRRKGKNIELYQTGRFLTVTGWRWGDYRTVEPRGGQIATLHRRLFGEEKTAPKSEIKTVSPSAPIVAGDSELLRRMMESRNGEQVQKLYAGQWRSSYASQSEADSALCFSLAFWTGRDALRMDALFRTSGLMRAKWDKPHSGDGRTYGQMTIEAACAKVSETYTPPGSLRLRGPQARAYIETGIEADITAETINASSTSPPARARLNGKASGAQNSSKNGQANNDDSGSGPPSGEAAGEAKPDSVPYAIERGRIVHLIEKTQRDGVAINFSHIVCDFSAHIVQEIADEEGEAVYLIAGRTPDGGVFHTEITARQYSDPRQLAPHLSAAAGAQYPVRAGMEKHLPSAIKLLTGQFARAHRFHRTGWCQVVAGEVVDGRQGQDAQTSPLYPELAGSRKKIGADAPDSPIYPLPPTTFEVFLIPGREPPDVEIILPRKLPYRIAPTANATEEEASLSRGLEAFESLLRAQRIEMASVAATVAFQAPLSRWAGWRNERYCLFIAGRTGSLKSTWAQALMCLYGPEFLMDDLIIKWGEGATRNALMHMASHVHDLPFLIDNYKPNTGGGSRDFISIIHNILEGGEKDRLTKNSTLRDARSIWTWPLATGEDIADNDAAALARILVVPFARDNSKDGEKRQIAFISNAQGGSRHLCRLGNLWLDFLCSAAGRQAAAEAAAQFPERRDWWATQLRQRQSDCVNPLRVASNLASNQLTWRTLERCPVLGEIAKAYSEAHGRGLHEIAGAMAAQTARALEAVRFLNALRELLLTGRCLIVERTATLSPEDSRRLIGYQAEDGAYLLPDATMKAVLDHLGKDGLGGMTPTMIFKQLHEMGALGSRDKDRFLKNVTINRVTQGFLHLSDATLRGPEIDENLNNSPPIT